MSAHHHHDEPPKDPNAEWRKVSDKVRNWGRWGVDDQLGTLNHITPAAIKHAASMVKKGKIIPCGVPFDAHGPQGAHGLRRNPIHLMTVDGGDTQVHQLPKEWQGPTEKWVANLLESGPGRFTDDYVIMPLQSCTQWDALSHFYYEDKLYNGFTSKSITSFGATRCAIDPIARAGQITGRGVLLDVARHRGVEHLKADEAVPPEELDEIVKKQKVEIRDGDILVIRTGWYLEWLKNHNGEEWAWHAPGLSWRCAEWCYDRNIAAVAADNVGVEVMKPELGIWSLFHMLSLRDMGMMLGEIWDLEALGADCAQDKTYEFQLIAQALPFTGAVGTPINPIAIK